MKRQIGSTYYSLLAVSFKKIRVIVQSSVEGQTLLFPSKVQGNSTQVLRDLEISLRTNPIEWVQEFLDVSTNNGLDVMIKYLSSLLCVMKQTELQQKGGYVVL